MRNPAAMRVVGLWAVLVGLGFGAVTAAESTPPDTLVLDNGQTLKGVVLDPEFNLRTAYGGLKLPRKSIASIDFTGDARGLHTVFTVHSNRFTGFIEESAVTFQPERELPRKMGAQALSQLIFAPPKAATSESLNPQPSTLNPAGATWLRLKNGDVLSGQVQPDPLPLRVTNALVSFALKEMSALVLTTNGASPPRLFLRNGKEIEAGLAAEHVGIALEDGPKLEIYGKTLETLCASHDLAVVGSSRLRAGPAGATALPEPFVGGTGTNLAGMVWIPAGTFRMGSPYDEPGRDVDEGPQREVVIPQGFWIGKYEVTQAEYEKVTGAHPSNASQDPRLPVEKVNWFEATDYCARLTRLAETAGWLPAGYAFRLPTEAEWEYCCRAGTITPFCSGEDVSEARLGQHAWFTGNSDFGTKPVGTRKGNAWGLHDMHGNVWEWCLDRWEASTQAGRYTNNPVAATGGLRVARGGSWLYDAKACRSANRDDYSPANRCNDIGFRVVLAPQ